jgi:hypothetical protein
MSRPLQEFKFIILRETCAMNYSHFPITSRYGPKHFVGTTWFAYNEEHAGNSVKYPR